MDPKKEIERIQEQLDTLRAELKEELPFQKELDAFLKEGNFKVIEAACGKVVLRGAGSGTEFRIRGNGAMSINPKGFLPYSLGLICWKRLVELAEAVHTCHDC